jgi:hypothetical protein
MSKKVGPSLKNCLFFLSPDNQATETPGIGKNLTAHLSSILALLHGREAMSMIET